MSDLLELALDAHGGLTRWREVSTIHARASATGAFFSIKGYGDQLNNVGIEVRTREQWTAFSPLLDGKKQRAICTPSQTVIEALDNNHASISRDNPASAFEGHTMDTPWDDLHLAFFLGYASWNYLNDPFILTLPGFKVEETEPWEENEQVWRRLKVTFPDYIATHSTDQAYYFNADGLLMRKDYNPFVRGRVSSAHYLFDHKTVDGLVLPERRRIYRRDSLGHRIPDPLIIGVDYADIRLT